MRATSTSDFKMGSSPTTQITSSTTLDSGMLSSVDFAGCVGVVSFSTVQAGLMLPLVAVEIVAAPTTKIAAAKALPIVCSFIFL